MSITGLRRLPASPPRHNGETGADEPCSGNLRLSARAILTLFIATYAGRVTSVECSRAHARPSDPTERSPTTPALSEERTEIRGFGGRLEPRWIVGAEPLDQGAVTLSLKDC